MKNMTQKEFYHNLLGFNLNSKFAEPCFIFVGRDTHGKLIAKLFNELLFDINGSLIVYAVRCLLMLIAARRSSAGRLCIPT
jgi:hypothetical protein